jgi:ribosomal-protein-alanine N-acetyltransferase
VGTPELLIRPMARTDLDRVLAIEHAVFPAPWSRRSFESELQGQASVPWVVERSGEVVAYLVSWLAADELHIGNIAVAPAAQGLGIGRELLRFCLDDAASRGVAYATLEVRPSNGRAIRLYEAFGFRPVAMRRGYYSDTGEDALVMMKDLAGGDGGA